MEYPVGLGLCPPRPPLFSSLVVRNCSSRSTRCHTSGHPRWVHENLHPLRAHPSDGWVVLQKKHELNTQTTRTVVTPQMTPSYERFDLPKDMAKQGKHAKTYRNEYHKCFDSQILGMPHELAKKNAFIITLNYGILETIRHYKYHCCINDLFTSHVKVCHNTS